MKMTKDGWAVWLYDYGIEKIQRAYDAARVALDQQQAVIQQDFEEHNAQFADDTDYKDHLIDIHEQAESSLSLIREAFALALHHFWEKSSNDFTGDDWYQYKQAYKQLKIDGYPVDQVGLEKLRKTANVIKHNKDELYKQYPQMFEKAVARDLKAGKKPDYHSELILTDADMLEFFKTVKSSGPQRATSASVAIPKAEL